MELRATGGNGQASHQLPGIEKNLSRMERTLLHARLYSNLSFVVLMEPKRLPMCLTSAYWQVPVRLLVHSPPSASVALALLHNVCLRIVELILGDPPHWR